MDNLHDRLVRCGRRNQWLTTIVLLQFVVLGIAGCVTTSRSNATPQSLRVRELDVVDDRGIVRVRIGSKLPDPIIRGKQVSRRRAVGAFRRTAGWRERAAAVARRGRAHVARG